MLRFTYSLFLIILSGAIFSSCVDSGETPDTTPPKIAVTNPNENQKVKGVITIAATTEDENKEVSMQIFLDENMIKSSSGKEISVEVDTKTLAEGAHTIRITALDGAENSSEKSLTIDVRNILFKFHMPSDYTYGTSERIYYGISRNDGSPIAFQQIFKNSDMIVPTPDDFNPDSTFVISKYAYADDPGVLVKGVNVYTGLLAGEYFVSVPLASRTIVGNHQVKVTDIPSAAYQVTITGKNASSTAGWFGVVSVIQTQLPLYNANSDLYFNFEITDNSPNAYKPVYNYTNSITAGGTTEFSLSSLSPMPKVDVATIDLVGSYNYTVRSNDPYSYNLYHREGNFVDGKIPVYYPSTALSLYDFEIQYQLGGVTYFNKKISASPPESFNYINAEVSNVNYANRKLKVKATGSYDVVTISSSSSNYDGVTFFYEAYTVSFPNGKPNQVVVPNTPTELVSLGFASTANTNFTSAYVDDYLTLSGLSDYQSKIAFSSDNVFLYTREFVGKSLQITPTNQPGRVAAHEEVILPESVKTILRNLNILEFVFH